VGVTLEAEDEVLLALTLALALALEAEAELATDDELLTPLEVLDTETIALLTLVAAAPPAGWPLAVTVK